MMMDLILEKLLTGIIQMGIPKTGKILKRKQQNISISSFILITSLTNAKSKLYIERSIIGLHFAVSIMKSSMRIEQGTKMRIYL